jgi:hypothetical protein
MTITNDPAKGPSTPDDLGEGLLPKYHVKRNDDPRGKHDACRYFVLDPEHDLVARRALAYYANDAREEGYTALADDLEAWVRSLWDAPTASVEQALPCPSGIADGRPDRCGLFAHPARCSTGRCSLTREDQ